MPSPIRLMLFRDPESQDVREGYVLWFEPPAGQVRGLILEDQAGQEIAQFVSELFDASPADLALHEAWLQRVLAGETGEVSGAVFRHLLALVQAHRRAAARRDDPEDDSS